MLNQGFLYLCNKRKARITMATPIKTTPVLKGSDSVYFYKQLAKTSKKKVADKDKKKIFSLVDKVLANSKSFAK